MISKKEKKEQEKKKIRDKIISDRNYEYVLEKDGAFFDKTCTCEYCPIHKKKRYEDIIFKKDKKEWEKSLGI